MEYLMLLLFHDCLVIIFNYFYYIRYKPPTFNLRLSVLCLPVFSFVVEMIFTVKNVVIFLLTKRAELRKEKKGSCRFYRDTTRFSRLV